MNEWSSLRTVLSVAVWLTLSGGVVMAAVWLRSGGRKAIGPEDELHAQAGEPVDQRGRRWTSFGSAQIGMHAMLGLMTAALVTYAATYDGERSNGYIGVAIAVIVTAIPGVAMFRKWFRGDIPRLPRHVRTVDDDRAEDHIPRIVAYVHGLSALATLGLIVALFFLDR